MASESAAEWCRNNLITVGDRLEVYVGRRAPITAGWAACRLVYCGTKMIIAERENSWVELARTSSRSVRTLVG